MRFFSVFMYNLYIFFETFTNGYRIEILDFFSLLSILSGIFVIISKNPIISVLFLIALFLSIASYLIIIGLKFIGLSYLLVYIGAVSILFLFILMLINVRISELVSETSNSIPLAFITVISFNYPLFKILPYSLSYLNSYLGDLNKTLFNVLPGGNFYFYLKESFNVPSISDDIAFVTANSWDGNLSECSDITSIGNIMYTSYSIWLILTSIILLLAMVGAIVITIKQKN